jgi:hypothetical protein
MAPVVGALMHLCEVSSLVPARLCYTQSCDKQAVWCCCDKVDREELGISGLRCHDCVQEAKLLTKLGK